MIGALRRPVGAWLGRSLKRKLAATLAASLMLGSLCFLALMIYSYRNRMLEERSTASTEINRLLQVSLENAMLKRDIDGLREIVERLGKQERIAGVMILAPDGEIRFASDARQLGRRVSLASNELCRGCPPGAGVETPAWVVLQDGARGEIVRSINPVRNREPCTLCHGPIASHPINGILVVDYDASQLKRETQMATLALSGAGLVILLGAVGGIGWVVQRSFLAPVQRLTQATRDLSLGKLGQSTPDTGDDEIGGLGRAFNAMSARIEEGVRAVQQRERYLQSVIDAMPDGVRVIDHNYRVVKANAAFCALHGLTLAEVLAVPCYRSSHGRDQPCPLTLVTCPMHELSKGSAPLTCRHRHVRRDGGGLDVEVSAALLETTGSREEAKGNALIVEVVRDLSRDVRISHEQRLSEIGLLAAGVAHEIHNPLSSIRLGFASVNRELAEGRFGKVEEYIRFIDEEIARCIAVTARLLKLSASPDDRPELVDLTSVIEDVVSLLSAEALATGVSVVVSMSGRPRIVGSDSEMRMLVLNLCQNALHAMPAGGTLKVTGETGPEGVRILFEDTGVGIAEADIPKIFDPFWSRRGDGVKGTGLGLSICREILARHHGRIGATSVLGKGSRFEVVLPSADAEAGSAGTREVALS